MKKTPNISHLLVPWIPERPTPKINEWYLWPRDFAHASVEDIVAEAFLRGLSRFCGWDLSKTNIESLFLFEQAAAIYKRGVAIRTPQSSPVKEYFPSLAPQKNNENYKIVFSDEAELFSNSVDRESSFFIVDDELRKHWNSLLQTFVKKSAEVKACESKKTFKTIESLSQDPGFINCTTVVAIGGGVVCDMAGFLASLHRKKFILVPTTLLAMADASVGGKTGVNVLGVGKNQLGCFANPECVLISPIWLKSLSKAQWASGFSECFKHALLTNDEDLFMNLVGAAKNQCMDVELLKRVISVKRDIVIKDPFEYGERALLNFGHTIAHAIEGVSALKDESLSSMLSTGIAHGHAVALGLVYETKLHEKFGQNLLKSSEELMTILRETGSLLSCDEYGAQLGVSLQDEILWEKMLPFIRQDKKSSSQNFLSLTNISISDRNSPHITDTYVWNVSEDDALSCWHETITSLVDTDRQLYKESQKSGPATQIL